MALPVRLGTLPDDCLRAVVAHLSLRDALRLAATCRALAAAVRRAFVLPATVLDVAHTAIDDTRLLALVRRAAPGAVRAVSVAACRDVTSDGVLCALRAAGPNVLFLDVSAVPDVCVDERFLFALREAAPNLRVLRAAYCRPVEPEHVAHTSLTLPDTLVTLDVACSPFFDRLPTHVPPTLRHIICPYTRFLERQIRAYTAAHHRVSSAPFNAQIHAHPSAVLVSGTENWVLADRDHAALLEQQTDWLVQPVVQALRAEGHEDIAASVETAMMRMVVRSAEWCRMKNWVVQHLPQFLPAIVPDSAVRGDARLVHAYHTFGRYSAPLRYTPCISLPVSAALSHSPRVARFLARCCDVDTLEGGAQSALAGALMRSESRADDPELIAALAPHSGLSVVQPVAVALIVLAASRKLPRTLDVLLQRHPPTNDGGRFQRALVAAMVAALDAPRIDLFPNPKDAFKLWNGGGPGGVDTSRSWLSSFRVSGRIVHPELSAECVPKLGVVLAAQKTAEMVDVLLSRGAAVDDSMLLRAAQLGYYDALAHMLLAGGVGEMEKEMGSTSFCDDISFVRAFVVKDFDALKLRMQKNCHPKRSLLVAAAKCDNALLSQRTVTLILRLMAAAERETDARLLIEDTVRKQHLLNDHVSWVFPQSFEQDDPVETNKASDRRHTANTQTQAFDEDAACAIVAALDNGNATVARMVADERSMAVHKVVQRRTHAVKALLAVGRRVGRGSEHDAAFIDVGARLIHAGGLAHQGGGVDKWLAEQVKDGHGRTVLHYAAGASNPAFARRLVAVAHRRLVHARDDFGATPLCVAVECHASRGCLKALLDAGAEVDAQDDAGRTALHRAAEARNGAAAALLLEFSADCMRADRKGITPAHVDTDLLYRASKYGYERDAQAGRLLHKYLDELDEEQADSRTL